MRDRLLAMEIARLATAPFRDSVTGETRPLLSFVDRVLAARIVGEEPDQGIATVRTTLLLAGGERRTDDLRMPWNVTTRPWGDALLPPQHSQGRDAAPSRPRRFSQRETALLNAAS
jgi:hypothetical protein